MTVEKLRQILDHLPAATQVYIETPEAVEDASTATVEYCDSGAVRLILSTKEG
jgi:hypothetical protein